MEPNGTLSSAQIEAAQSLQSKDTESSTLRASRSVTNLQRVEVPCPICDGRRNEVLYEPFVDVKDPVALYGAASGIRGTQRIVQCSACEMIFENPRFPDDVILAGYMSSDEHGHDSQYDMRVESFYRSLQSLKNRIPAPSAKVLDIGTAGGAFLDAAKKYGYDVHGLEPSKFLVERGVARGLQLRQGTIRDNDFADGTFDMVCLWDVIEHLTHPREDLAMIRRLLKPDGVFLINFPDIGTTQAKLAGKKFWWILSVHLHHFTRNTIRAICQKTGFEATYFQRYWQTLQFGYLVKMAGHLGVPGANFIYNVLPKFIRQIPLPYYASQTTALARKA